MGSTAAVIKLLLKNLNSIQILLYASFFASISLFIIILWQKKLSIIKIYTKKDYIIFFGMAFVGVFMYYILLYTAIQFSSAQEAFIVNYTWPLWIVILSIPILKEKFTWRKLLALILGFIGVYVIVSYGASIFSSEHIYGNILALIGAFCYGLFSVLGKKYNYERFSSMFFYFLFTFIFTFIAVISFSSIPLINFNQLMALLWIGIFPSSLAFVFWFLALKHGDTAIISNLAFITPFLSLIYIYFLLGEVILFSSLVGLSCIIAGVFIQLWTKNKVKQL